MRSGARASLDGALEAFLPGSSLADACPLGSGHIHDTFRVDVTGARGQGSAFVFQRINLNVFPDPRRLGANLERVTDALQAHRAEEFAAERTALRLLRDSAGRSHVETSTDQWWRAFPFIARSHSRESPRDAGQALAAAAAFGGFLADVDGLAPEGLRETIPGFHDLTSRLERLDAVEAEARPEEGRAEAEACRELSRAFTGGTESSLPLRTVHNDCKFNNLLFEDETEQVLCVVDLDTVMPGRAVYDFGDLVRTAASTCDEDERDLSRIGVDTALFEALGEGFVRGSRGALTEPEIQSLAWAGPRMALENAVRFLTDHWQGDPYFRVHHPGHNLERARAQLALARAFLAVRGPAEALFERLARSHGQP